MAITSEWSVIDISQWTECTEQAKKMYKQLSPVVVYHNFSCRYYLYDENAEKRYSFIGENKREVVLYFESLKE